MTKKSFAWFFMTLLAVAVAAYAIVIVAVPDWRPPFARTLFEDRPVPSITHFLCGAVALITGAFQFNTRLRLRFLNLHRWMGRLYIVVVLAGGVAALAMAPHAFGGIVAHSGFALLAVGWITFTLAAYINVRHGNLRAHQEWMIRSYALTLAAVTLRIYLPGSQIAGLSMAAAYPVIAWLCWVPNLMLAEWFIRARTPLFR
jgi:uncharacterized membrane protein